LVREFDGLVGTVVGGLKKYGFWDHTLLLVHTDNGGEMVFPDACARAAAWGKLPPRPPPPPPPPHRPLQAQEEAEAEAQEAQQAEVHWRENSAAGAAAAPSGIGFRGGAASNGALRGGKFTLWQV
jgi:arylsulfatase A-like enzyme